MGLSVESKRRNSDASPHKRNMKEENQKREKRQPRAASPPRRPEYRRESGSDMALQFRPKALESHLTSLGSPTASTSMLPISHKRPPFSPQSSDDSINTSPNSSFERSHKGAKSRHRRTASDPHARVSSSLPPAISDIRSLPPISEGLNGKKNVKGRAVDDSAIGVVIPSNTPRKKSKSTFKRVKKAFGKIFHSKHHGDKKKKKQSAADDDDDEDDKFAAVSAAYNRCNEKQRTHPMEDESDSESDLDNSITRPSSKFGSMNSPRTSIGSDSSMKRVSFGNIEIQNFGKKLVQYDDGETRISMDMSSQGDAVVRRVLSYDKMRQKEGRAVSKEYTPVNGFKKFDAMVSLHLDRLLENEEDEQLTPPGTPRMTQKQKEEHALQMFLVHADPSFRVYLPVLHSLGVKIPEDITELALTEMDLIRAGVRVGHGRRILLEAKYYLGGRQPTVLRAKDDDGVRDVKQATTTKPSHRRSSSHQVEAIPWHNWFFDE